MVDLPNPLQQRLDAELEGYSTRELARAADRLSDRYRADLPAAQPILASALDLAAYLTTRMPATYAAARQVFDRLARARPDFEPRSMLDLGAGTGTCTWAATKAFPSLESSHLVDSSPPALDAAKRMLEGTALHVRYVAGRIDRPGGWASAEPSAGSAESAAVGTAETGSTGGFDLAICGFLLGELDAVDQDRLLADVAEAAPVVVIIEPGTPAGYRRVLRARTALIAAGHAVIAPCPHEGTCPLEGTQDWCHFAVRLTRSIRHRQVKGGDRGYEDEKYAYVVAGQAPADRSGRILRHPQIRSGHVRMTVCTTDPGVQAVTVSKRHRDQYRAARHAAWGDSWTP